MISKACLFINPSLLLAILLMITSPLSAQPDNSRQIDSLKVLFPKQEGVEKIESLYELARLVADYDLDSAIYLDSMALDFLKDSYQSLWHVKLLTDLSYFHTLKFDYPPAKLLLDSALYLSKISSSKSGLIISYSELGNYFLGINLYDSALYNYHRSLKIEEELQDRDRSITLNNIGIVYYKIKNYANSLNYYVKAIDLNSRHGDSLKLVSNYVNMGLTYLAIDDLELAKEKFVEAIYIGEKYDSTYLAHAYDNLGLVFMKLNDFDSTYYYLSKAIDLGEKFNYQVVIAYSHSHLAELALNGLFFQRAKRHIDQSLSIIDKVGDKLMLSHNYQLYSQLYEALGQPDSAYYYHKKYIALKDSIFTPNLTHNLTNLQLSYQAEESQQVIEEKEQRLTQTTKYLWLAGMVLLICVVQLFRFYHRFL